MSKRRRVSRNGTSPPSVESDFWRDVEREGVNLLHCISPLRMPETPNLAAHPTKRRRRKRKHESVNQLQENTATPFEDPQPVRENEDVGQVDETQGTQARKNRKRRRKGRKSAAEKELRGSDRLIDDDGEESKSAFSGSFNSNPEKTKSELVVEQTKTVTVNEADQQRTVVHSRQSTNSRMPKSAGLDQNTSQTRQQKHALDRRKTIDVAEDRSTTTKQKKRSLREFLQDQQAISHLSTLRTSNPERTGKASGFPRASALIARFEAKRIQHIRTKRTSCASPRTVTDHAKAKVQDPRIPPHLPSPSIATATSNSKSSTGCVDTLMPHHDPRGTPTPARYSSIKERIANFSAKRQKRIREGRLSQGSTGQGAPDQEASSAQVDCQVSAKKGDATRIPESQNPVPCGERQPTPEPNQTFSSSGFQGVKARIAAFEEKQPRSNKRPRRKLLKIGKEGSLWQGPSTSAEYSQKITPDAVQHPATSTYENLDEVEGQVLIKSKPTGERDCSSIDKSKSNHDATHHEFIVNPRIAAESSCSESADRTPLALQSLGSPLVNQGGARTRSTKLLRRRLSRRQKTGESFAEPWTDAGSSISASSSDVTKKPPPDQSSSDHTANQSHPVEFTDCTSESIPSDWYKSSLICAIHALNAKPVHRKHHRRKRDTRVSSSETETPILSDLTDSVDDGPAQRQSPPAFPGVKTLPASAPFGFVKSTVHARRPSRKKKPNMEYLFSSSEDTDPAVASAKAASQEFLRKNPNIGDEDGKRGAAGCSDLDSRGCVYEDDGNAMKDVQAGECVCSIHRPKVPNGDADPPGSGDRHKGTSMTSLDEFDARFDHLHQSKRKHDASSGMSGCHHNSNNEGHSSHIDNYNSSLNSRVIASNQDVVEIDHTSLEDEALETPIEEVDEDLSSRKSRQSLKETKQNQPLSRTKLLNGLSQEKLRSSKKQTQKKVTRKTRAQQTETEKKEGLIVDLRRRLNRRKRQYKKRKRAEEKSQSSATRACLSRGNSLNPAKPHKSKKIKKQKKKKPSLLTTCSSAFCDLAVKEGTATKIQDNGESFQDVAPSFPLEWEDPLGPGCQRNMHRQYLQDRFFKLLSKRAKKRQQTYWRPRKQPEKQQKGGNSKKRIRKLKTELKNDGWIDYTALPEIFTLENPKRFIRKMKKKKK